MLLFSAPFYFLDNVKEKFNDLVTSEFREIWSESEIGNVENIKYWIPNPGQTFVINKKILSKFNSLKIIITPSTGTNHINIDDCTKQRITVRGLLDNLKTLNSIRASSEFTFLMILNGLRRLDFALKEVENNRWRQNEDLMRGNELVDKKVGIIGLGRNGSNIAKWCESFDAKVLYYDPYVKNQTYSRTDDLEKIFINSDIIVICCALNSSTKNMINKNLIEKVKKNALIVNTSRGELIDENDLAKIIKKRKDIRISLDVLSNEVIAQQFSSPLMKFVKEGRIILTPHIAGATEESQIKAAFGAFELLKEQINAKTIK